MTRAYLNEFAVRVPDAAQRPRAPARRPASSRACALARGIPMTRRWRTRCCVCATELTTDADIERLVERPARGAGMTEHRTRRTPSLVPLGARRSALGPDLQPTLDELSVARSLLVQGAARAR